MFNNWLSVERMPRCVAFASFCGVNTTIKTSTDAELGKGKYVGSRKLVPTGCSAPWPAFQLEPTFLRVEHVSSASLSLPPRALFGEEGMFMPQALREQDT